ncbi:uncharacterized protein TRIADDRAFT_61635 [Trichoplax adhaerens]|uniref:Uncharacterized protein n=1 Tax=Trichoplax adhaerens TaxID=10228 RepID=B3SBJ2_TRIAD|nr:predicted protein [Trichoplax adhaerens]EDV19863.1 predicted protein [Trichoplax adhaerens]|eukprot:XP_002117605.1 predicted protein [Trichoplax adhaerens]
MNTINERLTCCNPNKCNDPCIYGCLTACLEPWTKSYNCLETCTNKYAGRLEEYSCWNACYLMKKIHQQSYSSILQKIRGPINCLPFTGPKKYHVSTLRNSTTDSTPVISQDGYRNERCTCSPPELHNASISNYLVTPTFKKITVNSNGNFVIEIRWLRALGYHNDFEVQFIVPIRNPPNGTRRKCNITTETNIKIVIDRIANLSHADVHEKGIDFIILRIPNPSNFYHSQTIGNKVTMAAEVKKKYYQKYREYFPSDTAKIPPEAVALICLASAIALIGTSVYLYLAYHLKLYPVAERTISSPDYVSIVHDLFEENIDLNLLRFLDGNRIGYNVVGAIDDDIATPIPEIVMRKLTTCSKIILYLSPEYIRNINKYQKRDLRDFENDSPELMFAKCTWSLMLRKLYNCPRSNDVIVVTNTSIYPGSWIRFARYHLAFPSTQIRDLKYDNHYDPLLRCLRTARADLET